MTLFRTMVTDSFIALFAVLALLQHILPVHPFVARTASISTSRVNVLRRHRQTLRPLRAEKSDDDDDDLSNNFLNFLKKNKEEEDEEEEEEEEEDEKEKVVDAKAKPNIFQELTSG